MKRFSIFLLLLGIISFTATGYVSAFQGIPVTGTVVDDSNEALPGVSVLERGTLNGAVTDASGRFMLTVSSGNSVLQFSFIGFSTQEVVVGDQRIFNISMSEDTQRLEEVVVVGYGTQQKRDITGSVAVVSTQDLLKSTGSSALEKLQGRASGVYVSTSGAAGGRSMVRIRGVNTLNDNGPLYVIDGVSSRGQDLSSMNPNDIESMQILKDASASAIYGAQAANGVILITTKKGLRTGQPILSYSGYYGFQKTGKRYDLLNSKERMDLQYKSLEGNLKNSGRWENGDRPTHPLFKTNAAGNGFEPYKYLTNAGGIDSYDETMSDYVYPSKIYAPFGDTNWWDEVTRDFASEQSHQFSLSGGSDKGMYNMSVNIYDQKSVLNYYYFKRYTTRLNTQFDVRKWLRLGENLSFSWMRDLGRTSNASESTLYSWVYRSTPFVPVRDFAGNFAGSKIAQTSNMENPVSIAYREKDNYYTNTRLMGDVWLEVDLFKGMTFRSMYGLIWTTNRSYRMDKRNLEFAEPRNTNNLEEVSGFNFRHQWTNTATYRTILQDIHRLTILLGTEAIDDGYGRSMTARRENYMWEDDVDTWVLNMGVVNANMLANSSWNGRYASFGYFGRVEYSLMDKYLLTVNVRRDGVSRFSSKYRYGTFPSASLGWRVSEEGFMLNTRSWLDDLKVRVGYGKVGNAEGPSANNWASEFAMSTNQANYPVNGSNQGLTAFRQSRVGNENTKWEAVESFNIGLDASFLRGKFGVSFEWYNKNTTDMLIQAAWSNLAGEATRPYINFGNMNNKGFDLSLNYSDSKGDFGWDVTLTAFAYKNKVTKMTEGATPAPRWAGADRMVNSGQICRTIDGDPIAQFYGYKVNGFYENAEEVLSLRPLNSDIKSTAEAQAYVGRYKFAKTSDTNPGQLTQNDRTHIGNPHPKLIGSLNIGLSYKNFDLTTFWYSSLGNELFNITKLYTDFQLFNGNRSHRMLNESWEPGKTNAILPMLNSADNYSYQVCDYFVENASFLRMKNLVLGYTLPKSWLQLATIQNLRFYIQMENLITITKYSGLDPEFTNRDVGGGNGADLSRGIDAGAWPNIKKFIFGVNFVF